MSMNGVTIGPETNIIAVVQVIILPVPAVVLTVCTVVVAGAIMPEFAARRIVAAISPQTFSATFWGSACASPSNNFHFMSRSAHIYKVLSGRYEMMGEKAKSRGERSRLGKAFSLIIE